MLDLFDFSEFPVLTTERLLLRQVTHADAEAIIDIYSHPKVLEFLNQEPIDTPEKAVAFIDWFNGNYHEHKMAVDWGIMLRGQNRMIGSCGGYSWDRENRKLDIGYHLLPGYWGKGYATEAVHAMLRWFFPHMNLHRIQADCTEGNTASERVMLKCGFTHEGTWRESCMEHGRFVNIKQYGLLRREYMGDGE